MAFWENELTSFKFFEWLVVQRGAGGVGSRGRRVVFGRVQWRRLGRMVRDGQRRQVAVVAVLMLRLLLTVLCVVPATSTTTA